MLIATEWIVYLRFTLPYYKRGKSKGKPEGEITRVRLPRTRDNELFAVADQLLGASRIKVMCEDGKSRMGRIPGKLKKRMWIREGDLVIVKPWDFQEDKADIKYRYTKTQSSYLKRRGMIPKSIDVF
ncbi:MAG: translation initiation factor eIF-1A [Methanobacteriota archaeon]|nr:MAG: translation initiation factor eIF-1A [Euryarchaeota archaeon]